MEGSKSDGNKKNRPKDIQNTVINDQIVIDILESSVEREIQNVLMTVDHSQPCCSWRDPGTKSDIIITNKIEPVQAAANNDKSEPSTASVTPTSTFHHHPTPVHECHDETHIFENHNTTHIPLVEQIPAIPTGSFIIPDVFRGTESIREPSSETAPPTYLESPQEAPPNGSRGVSIVNFPDVSMLQTMQRETLRGPPPSYSKSLLDRRVNPCASIQFVAPIPPPSYDGVDNELRYAGYSGFTLGLGNTWQSQPQPAYCPVCETVIITQVDIRISRVAHIIAMVMFILLCWPFCLLPYFFNMCNYTFHFCSVCHCYLGARRPFQRT